MKNIKNIAVGFLVSFIGSVPLGYLNVIGYEVYLKSGIRELTLYLLGVVTVEAVVIFLTLLFADKLTHNKRLIKYIEIFSIIFMLLLAFSFYASASETEAMPTSNLSGYINYPSFVIGIIFSSLNFIQIPFWTGWNLYLINGNHITVEKTRKYFYLAGTLWGTFSGMMALVFFLDVLTATNGYLSKYLMKYIIPLVFLGMGLYQGYTFYKKYHSAKEA